MNDDALLAALGERISSLAAELIDIRRDFHAHPELSREEVRTTQTVARRLDAAGVGVRLLPGTGLLADIVGLPGNPLDDITVTQNVKFVMKGGKVFVNN